MFVRCSTCHFLTSLLSKDGAPRLIAHQALLISHSDNWRQRLRIKKKKERSFCSSSSRWNGNPEKSWFCEWPICGMRWTWIWIATWRHNSSSNRSFCRHGSWCELCMENSPGILFDQFFFFCFFFFFFFYCQKMYPQLIQL